VFGPKFNAKLNYGDNEVQAAYTREFTFL